MRNTIDDILYSPITGSSSTAPELVPSPPNKPLFERIYDSILFSLMRFRRSANEPSNRACIVRIVKSVLQSFQTVEPELYMYRVCCDETNNPPSVGILSLITLDVEVHTVASSKIMQFFI